MKIFAIQPGASNSTADVYTGMVSGLEQLGHEVIGYQLDTRIARAGHWLDSCWRMAKEKRPDIPEPTTGDVLFQACGDSVVKAMWKKPDWVIVVSAMYYPKLFLKMLKQAGLRLAVLLTESPYDDDQQYSIASIADICWTNERTSVPRLQVVNPKTYYLPHAYNPQTHTVVGDDKDAAAHDVVFVGTGFQERIDLFEAIDWDGIDLGLYGTWELVSSRSRLKQYIRGEDAIGNDMAAALYRKTKIGLNLYRSSKGFGCDAPRIAIAESMNPRAYELAACGTFYISNYRAEIPELFGSAVPTFVETEALEGLIRYWLKNNEERERVAASLPRLVEGETWLSRAKQMTEDLEREFHSVPVLAGR